MYLSPWKHANLNCRSRLPLWLRLPSPQSNFLFPPPRVSQRLMNLSVIGQTWGLPVTSWVIGLNCKSESGGVLICNDISHIHWSTERERERRGVWSVTHRGWHGAVKVRWDSHREKGALRKLWPLYYQVFFIPFFAEMCLSILTENATEGRVCVCVWAEIRYEWVSYWHWSVAINLLLILSGSLFSC